MRKLVYMVVLAALLAACGVAKPVLTVSATATTTPSLTPLPMSFINPSPTPTITPSETITPTSTVTPEPGTPPGCQIVGEDGKLFLISDKEFHWPGTGDGELDKSLRGHFPEWAAYTQPVSWSTEPVTLGEVVNNASTDVTSFGINSAVALVTLGEIHNWEDPIAKDLYLETEELSKQLFYLAADWVKPENDHIRDQYPQISNEATYALYAFFDYDEAKLESWCEAYQLLFGISSLD